MIPGFAVALVVCALAVAVWAFALAVADRPPARPLLIGLGVVETLLVVQVVISVVLLIAGERPGDLLTFLSYLIGVLFVLPLGTVWALAERSRASTAVLGVACGTVPVLLLRMYVVWVGGGAGV